MIFQTAHAAIWHDTRADEYYVYSGAKLVRVCPSIGMAREVASGL